MTFRVPFFHQDIGTRGRTRNNIYRDKRRKIGEANEQACIIGKQHKLDWWVQRIIFPPKIYGLLFEKLRVMIQQIKYWHILHQWFILKESEADIYLFVEDEDFSILLEAVEGM